MEKFISGNVRTPCLCCFTATEFAFSEKEKEQNETGVENGSWWYEQEVRKQVFSRRQKTETKEAAASPSQ